MKRELVTNHSSGKDIYKIKLTNTKGTEVHITNYGNIVSAFIINGVNIVLGFDDINFYLSETYLSAYPYFGCVVGRTANRIKNGKFNLNEKEFQLKKNMGVDNLHGGIEGFDKKAWDIIDSSASSISLQYISADGEEGYPGTLTVNQTYTLTDDNGLIIESNATTDNTTIINLTHHDYFNLNGNGRIDNHFIKIYADKYLGQDIGYVTDGSIVPVENTKYDFRKGKPLNMDWNPATGYDQTFLINNFNGQLQLAAEATGDISGIKLQVYTTEPVVHMYNGVGIAEFIIEGKKKFGPFAGLCFETQKEPNAINIPHFSNIILNSGELYSEKTIYKVVPPEEK